MDGEMFRAYLIQVLIPTLRTGDILVMDNLSAHKSHLPLNVLSEKGISVLFLPPYSPDLNPIEKMWSKVKQLLRGVGAKTKEALLSAIQKAFEAVTSRDAKAWIKSCGYAQSQA